jgi:hypothetical protein
LRVGASDQARALKILGCNFNIHGFLAHKVLCWIKLP